MLGSAPLHDVWQDTRGDGPQPLDDLSCIIKASRVRIAGSQIPIYSGVAGEFIQSSHLKRPSLPTSTDAWMSPTKDLSPEPMSSLMRWVFFGR